MKPAEPRPESRRQRWSRLPFTNGTFVALCAVALAWETSLVAQVPRRPWVFYAFLFLATFAGYRLHAIASPDRRAQLGRSFALITIAAAALASMALVAIPASMWPAIALAGLLTAAYSLPLLPGRRRVREFGVGKIVCLTGVWTLATAFLPVQGLVTPLEMTFLLVRRFAFLFALCVAFDVRDHERDARAGIRTIPVLIGVRRAHQVATLALVLFALLVLASPLVGSRNGHPAGLIVAALLTSALVTWIAIERSRRTHASDIYYLRFVDGMMLAQCLLVAIAFWLSALR